MSAVKDPGIDTQKTKMRELEKKLAQALQDRDDLARDLETMCLEAEPATFSSSSVLRERIFATEKDLSRTKTELRHVTDERNSLNEDLREIKEAKRAGDQAFKQQAARVAALERELGFYRQQAAQAIADRDSATWESEQLRQQNAELQAATRDAQTKAAAAEAQQIDADRRRQQAEERADSLQSAAREAEALPALRDDVDRTKARAQAAEKDRDAAVKNISALRDELRHANEASIKAVDEAEAKLKAAQEEATTAREQLDDVARQKVEALMRLSQAESDKATADREVTRLREALKQMKEQFETAAQQKVQALLQLAEQQQADVESGRVTPRSGRSTPSSMASPAKMVANWTPDKWKMFGGGTSPAKPSATGTAASP